MTSEHIRQRSDLLGTQVITRDTGKRLGIVSQLWVDIDRREVVAIGMRESLLALPGIPKFMRLSEIRQIGDVILVDDDRAVADDFDMEAYSNLINMEVITEDGERLGRVRGFKLDTRDGKVVSIIIASVGLPQIPDRVLSTYELGVEEIVSSGPDRLIVFEGSEERLVQLTEGWLEQLNLTAPPWERDEEEFPVPQIRYDNQLPSGMQQRVEERPPLATPVPEEWTEDDAWQEEEPLYQEAEVYYEEEPLEDNWSEASQTTAYERADYAEEYPPTNTYREPEYADDYEDVQSDAWADEEEAEPYQPPEVNLPERTRMPEYEEERGY